MKKMCLIIFLLFFAGQSFSAVHEVKALGVKFEPMFVIMEPGDTVSWTNMAAHLVETIDTMVPEGTPKLLTDMGANVSQSFDKPGIYIYKCTPHWGARMGGIIMVGKPDNIEETLNQYLAEIKKDKSNLPAKGLIKKFKKHLKKTGQL